MLRIPTQAAIVAAVAAALVAACAGERSAATETGQMRIDGADAGRGRALLAQHQCGRCHTIPGVEAAQGRVAVSLEALGRRSYLAGRIPNRPEALVRWIADPATLVPGTLMPDQGVSDADARDMAAYLLALR